MSRRICRYHNTPGGCRRGANCDFQHIDNPQQPSGSHPTSEAPRLGSPTSSSLNDPPRGVCRYFWTTGSCRLEFQCRYDHTASMSTMASPAADRRSSAINVAAPFLTESAIAKLTGSGTDVYFSNNEAEMSPNEAHSHLKRFLRDDYRFKISFDIYAFLKTLNSASETNTSWTSEEGQMLLGTISSDNGLRRIGEILRWSPVSMQSGSSRNILSFQRGILPLLRYYSSSFVVKSTLSHSVNALYMQLMDNFENFAQAVTECMKQAIAAGSFKDNLNQSSKPPAGIQVIPCLADVLYEFMTRIKDAVAKQPKLIPLVRSLQEWTTTWESGVSVAFGVFDDPLKDTPVDTRKFVLSEINGKIHRLLAVMERQAGKLDQSTRRNQLQSPKLTGSGTDGGVIAALRHAYEGPGDLRRQGPRHDNDFIDIQQIRIAPTHGELGSRFPPYLPANLYDAPHTYPADSMERLLDIQFRLLREELTAPLRTAVQLIQEDLEAPKQENSKLSKLLDKRGGKYRGHSDHQDGILFDVYTNVELLSLVPDRRGITVGVSLDAPPGRARASQAKARASFWEGVSGKRLMQGGLVALIWQSGGRTDVYLGTVANSLRDLVESSRAHPDRVSLRIMFYDSEVMLRTLDHLTRPHSRNGDTRVMLEAPVMFEAIRPFLEALRVEPESLPFARYIVHRPPEFFHSNSIKVDPPKYAMAPGFYYQLASLFPPEAGVADFKLFPTNQDSVDAARQALRDTRLDPSQAEAVVDTLTRELSLIQGPPGTGKSFTGVELIRVLLKNKIRPILMIAFTNHALDHMLHSVLDADITQHIVRLGSRSTDEKIGSYSLETMEMVAGQSRLDRTFGQHHRVLKEIQHQILELMKRWSRTSVDSHHIMEYIEIQYPEHFEHISQPPRWIQVIYQLSLHSDDDDDEEVWQHVGNRGRRSNTEDNSMYAFWRCGRDLGFLSKREDQGNPAKQPESPPIPQEPANQNKFQALDVDPIPEDDTSDSQIDEDESNTEVVLEPWEKNWSTSGSSVTPAAAVITMSMMPIEAKPTTSQSMVKEPPRDAIQPSDFTNLEDFLATYGYSGQHQPPSSDRLLDVLLEEGAVWSLSVSERARLHNYWTESVRTTQRENQLQDFQDLSDKHAMALKIYNEGKDEIRRNLLRNVEIVGCTTTGAAKLTNLLKGLSPRVMLVEEAGQVLEAHVLGSLVPSVEHLILIGDPLQLRPTLNNFSLSMDNHRGRQLYRFDMSLMERLATAGLPMTQINTQRRMRPMIANLVRNFLYPKLEDHDLVKKYPDVRGLSKNIFFFSHSHPENGGEDSGSKYNLFEVDMIKDLVLYLLRQGCYSQEGDIVVLCAYLGQLAKVRDALHDEVAVVIDERDQAALDDQEGEEDVEISVEHVKVSKRVRLRTIDNYQGEEARIVILSLVRNSGLSDEEAELLGSATRANIGFLKSENRTNVALSRAKEGLYILGNAANMASRSRMWQSIVEELEKQQAVGDAFPIACHQHPDAIDYVSKPGVLRKIAPDGGCMKPCSAKLKCGHLCPYKCHPDDPNHVAVSCDRNCGRLCPKGHPCSKPCADSCGDCLFPGEVELPCGHIKSRVPCYLRDNPEEISCDFPVNRSLPNCDHSTDMNCSDDPKLHRCIAPCGGIMSCCGRNCSSRCYQCQELNARAANQDQDQAEQRKHCQHPCQKPLFCAHRCQLPCSEDHQCATVCKDRCRQECPHAKCKEACSEPCAPCQEPCTWKCDHYSCPLPCGSICARLPCDRRCDKSLECGHRCPSVCGEPCLIQICPVCAPDNLKSRVVDMVMYRTLRDVNVEKGTLDELLITIPTCRHVFTVETLDGICRMTDYFRREGEDGKWLGLKAPELGFQKPPVCPTCRVAITSPRYGRIFKRADLDVLELNVASRSCRSLKDLQLRLNKISRPEVEASLNISAGNIEVTSIGTDPKTQQSKAKKRNSLLRQARDVPIPYKSIDPGNQQLHDISPIVVQIWQAATDKIKDAYCRASGIAATRSAHIKAWESAFSYLYRHEIEMSASNPSQAPRKPEEHAMRMARIQVGQSKPRADKKYAVEAVLLTVQIRFLLVDLALFWLRTVKAANNGYPTGQLMSWGTFGLFLIDTCMQDANLALKTATESESRQQMTRSSLFCMRSELERFRYNVEMLQQSGNMRDQRDAKADEALQKKSEAQRYMSEVLVEHRAVKGRGEEEWLQENFINPAGKILDEWQKIERSLRYSASYEPVSLEETISIVKAFSLEFTHTGHFYRCANGHVFVIGECGGAAERSRCNECGLPIGGAGHQLDATNAQALDMEELARAEGAQPSPWAWGV